MELEEYAKPCKMVNLNKIFTNCWLKNVYKYNKLKLLWNP